MKSDPLPGLYNIINIESYERESLCFIGIGYRSHGFHCHLKQLSHSNDTGVLSEWWRMTVWG